MRSIGGDGGASIAGVSLPSASRARSRPRVQPLTPQRAGRIRGSARTKRWGGDNDVGSAEGVVGADLLIRPRRHGWRARRQSDGAPQTARVMRMATGRRRRRRIPSTTRDLRQRTRSTGSRTHHRHGTQRAAGPHRPRATQRAGRIRRSARTTPFAMPRKQWEETTAARLFTRGALVAPERKQRDAGNEATQGCDRLGGSRVRGDAAAEPTRQQPGARRLPTIATRAHPRRTQQSP